jgi:hypothetical protein
MTKRYTPTVLDGSAHMEIMGAGEWVRWDDYERARADGYADGVRDAAGCIPSQHDLMDREGDRQRILALAPASPAEPAQVVREAWTQISDVLPERDEMVQLLCRVLPEPSGAQVRSCELAVSIGDYAERDLFVTIGYRCEVFPGAPEWEAAGWDMAQDCWTSARLFSVEAWQPLAIAGGRDE